MKEILETIVRNLVSDENSVEINEIASEKEIKYEVKVNETDMGKIIGRHGKIATSIRTVMKAVASKENKKVTIEFID